MTLKAVVSYSSVSVNMAFRIASLYFFEIISVVQFSLNQTCGSFMSLFASLRAVIIKLRIVKICRHLISQRLCPKERACLSIACLLLRACIGAFSLFVREVLRFTISLWCRLTRQRNCIVAGVLDVDQVERGYAFEALHHTFELLTACVIRADFSYLSWLFTQV